MQRNDFVSNSSSSSFVCATSLDFPKFRKELLDASVKFDLDGADKYTFDNAKEARNFMKELRARNKENIDNYMARRLLFIGQLTIGETEKTRFGTYPKYHEWNFVHSDVYNVCDPVRLYQRIDEDKIQDNSYHPNGYIDQVTIDNTLSLAKTEYLKLTQSEREFVEKVQDFLNRNDRVFVVSIGYQGEGEDSDYIYVWNVDMFFDNICVAQIHCPCLDC